MLCRGWATSTLADVDTISAELGLESAQARRGGPATKQIWVSTLSMRALACAGVGGGRTLTGGKSLMADNLVPDGRDQDRDFASLPWREHYEHVSVAITRGEGLRVLRV